ncbi:hypothetical protein LSH36_44g00024 [Paralvinella palmiformis]|uniref:Uncharacterized protein n=1 Tax=Paralvinella palmiformis TaxID=53620 RepID=A0AAD9K8B8_9ANNE|nr:hypothetical protein LSH36_44g00024 [Paralvinella palmiformis]
MIFLAISWYRRRKSSVRRRRQRLRQRHLIELDLIRRQLASRTELGDPRIELSASQRRDSVENTALYNPPPYSEALDTTLYPAVSISTAAEDLPSYRKVTENVQLFNQVPKDTQMCDGTRLKTSVDVVPNVSNCTSDENQNTCVERPPSYANAESRVTSIYTKCSSRTIAKCRTLIRIILASDAYTFTFASQPADVSRSTVVREQKKVPSFLMSLLRQECVEV